MSDGTTNLEVLIQIREELAGLRKTRTELQGAKKDAGALGDAIQQGLGIGSGMQMVTSAIGMLRSGLQKAVVDVIRMAGEVKDASEALQITAEAYQTLKIEAQGAGAEMGTITTAMSRQRQSLAEARDASSGAAQAYRALNLHLAELEGMDPVARLVSTARAIREAKDQTEAYSAAAQILGARGLPQLLNALSGIRDLSALENLRKKQGEILSDDQIARIDRLGKAWDQAGRGWSTSWGKIVDKGFGAVLSLGQSLSGEVDRPAASATPASTTAATPAPDVAISKRQQALSELKTAQTELLAVQDKVSTVEAAAALTAEQKAALRQELLGEEIAIRERILALIKASQDGDFRDAAEKQAELIKARGDLDRAMNARDSAGNTAAQQQARELFRLETEAIAASAAGNTRIAEQKREQIKQLQLTAQLEGQQPALVQARIAAERELTEAQRARAAQELDFSRRLGAVDQAVALVEADNALTETERRTKILPLLAEQNRLIRERIALLEQDTRLQQGDQTSLDLQKTIDELRKQLSDVTAKSAAAAGPETLQMRDGKALRDLSDPSQHYQTADQGVQGGLLGWVTQVGTMADQLATSISSNLQTAVDAVSSGIAGWFNGTQSWGQMINSIRVQIGTQLVGSIIRMGTEWLLQQALIRTGMIATTALGTTLKAAEAGTTIAAETAKTPILATNAALASVSSFGIASIIGIALLLAGIGAIAALAFEKGGVIPGGEKLIRVNENGTESVLNARATSLLGADTIAALNSGNLAALADLLGADVSGGIAAPIIAMQQAATPAAAAAAGGSSEAANVSINLGLHSSEKNARAWAESQSGQRHLVNLMKRNGFRTV